MNKKVVLGIVAGVSVVGGITGLVVSSVKILHTAKKYYEEAGKIVEKKVEPEAQEDKKPSDKTKRKSQTQDVAEVPEAPKLRKLQRLLLLKRWR